MRDLLGDTIVAPATAAGAAGLAVVRLSGPAALQIGATIFRGADLVLSESHRAHHGFVVDGDGRRIDEVLALVLRAPRSYTGEDTVEFSCHGSPVVVEDVVTSALAAGARYAEAGEFTRRAFLNGKMDLCQAEAVADLVAATSRAGSRAALAQLRGRLSRRLRAVRGPLVRLLADIEASIDFVEEEIEFYGGEGAAAEARAALAAIEALLATAADGMLLRAGARVSLAGAPNVGKSSLFNRILATPRSIVTEHPGTTRDVVCEALHLDGVLVQLEDTAGLSATTADPVEAMGIERSRASHAGADVILMVVDASRPMAAEEREALHAWPDAAAIVALNKVDLLEAAERCALLADRERAAATVAGLAGARTIPHACVGVSARTGEGLGALLEALTQRTRLGRLALQNDAVVCINLRHRDALLGAREALGALVMDIDAGEPAEILAADLREALMAVDEVSGDKVAEAVLDSIFARFCIGK